MILKTVVLLSAYIGPLIALIFLEMSFAQALLAWSLMGVAAAGIGMSVMHDACHGAYSPNPLVNRVIGTAAINLIGGMVFNWKLQHNKLHHTFTNIVGHDDDIAEKGLFRFSPHNRAGFFHQFQWIYAFLIYGITTIYWSTVKDFLQFFKYTREGVNTASAAENRLVVFKMIFLKLAYFGLFLGLPWLVGGLPFLQVLGGFLAMHFVCGVILTVVFQLAHTVEGTSHPLPVAETGIIENDWAIHQMNTTVNFARKNRWLSWYVGGLNFQVEHHLFTNICHVHYPKIAPIVKQTAEEFGIPYLENRTFGQALASHIAALKRFGRLPDLNEAIG